MAMQPSHPGLDRKQKGIVTKEFLVGMLAIILGGFNLATRFNLISISNPIPTDISQMIANLILVIAGLILWMTAYKLWRYRWHSSRIF